VPWYLHPKEKNEYIQTNYIATGDLTKTITHSEDGLTQTVVNTYANKRLYNKMVKDELVNADNDIRNAYQDASGIIENITIETIKK
jgi:hypothetical protein